MTAQESGYRYHHLGRGALEAACYLTPRLGHRTMSGSTSAQPAEYHCPALTARQHILVVWMLCIQLYQESFTITQPTFLIFWKTAKAIKKTRAS